MPFSLIPFILLFIPILEIAVFIVIGGQIGVVATLAMILFTAILGSILLRFQGFSIINRIREQTQQGKMPSREIINGVMIVVAGVLLLTPGFVTDGLGFLLFIPMIRSLIWSTIASKIILHTSAGMQGNQPPPPNPAKDNVVDLEPEEFSEKADPDSPWISIDKRPDDK